MIRMNKIFLILACLRLPLFADSYIESDIHIDKYKDKYDAVLKNYGNIFDKIDSTESRKMQQELQTLFEEYEKIVWHDIGKMAKWKETKQRLVGFDQDGFTQALLMLKNPTEAEANFLKGSFNKYEEYFINDSAYKKIVPMTGWQGNLEDELVVHTTGEPSWDQVIEYLGGYSKLADSRLTKDDINKFIVNIVVESIEIRENGNCTAIFKRMGDDLGLKYHNISKGNYNIEGTYEFLDFTPTSFFYDPILKNYKFTKNVSQIYAGRWLKPSEGTNIRFNFTDPKSNQNIQFLTGPYELGANYALYQGQFKDIMMMIIDKYISDDMFTKHIDEMYDNDVSKLYNLWHILTNGIYEFKVNDSVIILDKNSIRNDSDISDDARYVARNLKAEYFTSILDSIKQADELEKGKAELENEQIVKYYLSLDRRAIEYLILEVLGENKKVKTGKINEKIVVKLIQILSQNGLYKKYDKPLYSENIELGRMNGYIFKWKTLVVDGIQYRFRYYDVDSENELQLLFDYAGNLYTPDQVFPRTVHEFNISGFFVGVGAAGEFRKTKETIDLVLSDLVSKSIVKKKRKSYLLAN